MEAALESCIDYVCVSRLFVLGWLYKVTIWLDSMHPAIEKLLFKCQALSKDSNFNGWK